MFAKPAPFLLAAALAVTAPDLAEAQANGALRCIASPNADCVIELAERSFAAVPENRWHLVVPNLGKAMFLSGRAARGLELAGEIQSPVVRRSLHMAQAQVLVRDGDLAGARAVLDAHGATAGQRVSEAAGWARAAYQRGNTAQGDAAVELARTMLQDHETATGEVVAAVTLPGAVAASGDTDAAIEMVREIPELSDRVSAAFLLVLDLAAGPDADRARTLLRDASAWRARLDPVPAAQSLIGEAWAWLALGDTGRALKLADGISDPRQRDGTLALLVLQAGTDGNADGALFLASRIKAGHEKVRALAECARAAFVSGHREAAARCLEGARAPVLELTEAVKRGGLDADLRADIDRALGAAAIALSRRLRLSPPLRGRCPRSGQRGVKR
jgi:hypothetical protein